MRNIKKTKLNKNKNFRGFSILEVMIAMFIFVVVITAAVSVFARITLNRQRGREIQKNMEAARVALDSIAKNMRMSTAIDGRDGLAGGIAPSQKYKDIIMLNNSQGVCIEYRFRTDGENSYLETGQAFPNSQGDCRFGDVSNFGKIIEGDVSGFFSVVKTSSSVIGKANIALTVDDVNLETSVSFRDYSYNK